MKKWNENTWSFPCLRNKFCTKNLWLLGALKSFTESTTSDWNWRSSGTKNRKKSTRSFTGHFIQILPQWNAIRQELLEILPCQKKHELNMKWTWNVPDSWEITIARASNTGKFPCLESQKSCCTSTSRQITASRFAIRLFIWETSYYILFVQMYNIICI